MRFSAILSVASIFSFATIVSAGPVVARQEDQALTVFQTLKGQTDTILPQISESIG